MVGRTSPLAIAAKGFLGMIFRQILGHWRKFDIHFFGPDRQPYMIAHHPFRFFFQRLEVTTPDGKFLGAVQQRFAIFRKRFDIENATTLRPVAVELHVI